MFTELRGQEGLETLLSQLSQVRRSGGAYTARCPAHPDNTPSFRVGLNERGKVWAICNASCTEDAVAAALDVAPLSSTEGARRLPIRRHVYEDPDGSVIAIKNRLRCRGSKFSWEGPDGATKLDGVDPGLYRRPSIDRALRDRLEIWIAEGEFDADTLASFGLAATSAAFGRSWRPAYTRILAGATVVFVSDRDAPGVEYANSVAAELTSAGCSVRKMVPPTPYKDVSDVVQDGGSPLTDLLPLTAGVDLGKYSARRTKDGRPVFAMIPGVWIEKLDPFCLRLVCFLDMEQGSAGRPMEGRNALSEAFRGSRATVSVHMRHLEDQRIVKATRDGQKKAVYTLMNPARLKTALPGGPLRDPLLDREKVHSSEGSGPRRAPLPRSQGMNMVLEKFPRAEVTEKARGE